MILACLNFFVDNKISILASFLMSRIKDNFILFYVLIACFISVRTASARVAPSNKVISKVSFPRGFGSKTRSSNDYRTLAQFEWFKYQDVKGNYKNKGKGAKIWLNFTLSCISMTKVSKGAKLPPNLGSKCKTMISVNYDGVDR